MTATGQFLCPLTPPMTGLKSGLIHRARNETSSPALRGSETASVQVSESNPISDRCGSG